MDAPGFIVVRIGFEHLAAAYAYAFGMLADTEILGIGICLERPWTHTAVGVCPSDVEACTDIEAQGFQAMNLVVRTYPAYEPV